MISVHSIWGQIYQAAKEVIFSPHPLRTCRCRRVGRRHYCLRLCGREKVTFVPPPPPPPPAESCTAWFAPSCRRMRHRNSSHSMIEQVRNGGELHIGDYGGETARFRTLAPDFARMDDSIVLPSLPMRDGRDVVVRRTFFIRTTRFAHLLLLVSRSRLHV